jgi:dCMP deaminase
MIIGIIGDLKSGKTTFSEKLSQKLKEKNENERIYKKDLIEEYKNKNFSFTELLNISNTVKDYDFLEKYDSPLIKNVSNGLIIIDNFGTIDPLDYENIINRPGFIVINIFAGKQRRLLNNLPSSNLSGDTTIDEIPETDHRKFHLAEVEFERKFKPLYKFNKRGFPVYDIINDGDIYDFDKNIDDFIGYIKKHNQQVRVDWDQYFIQLTWAISERSNCIKNKGGSIIVSPDYRIVSTGYAGTPHGQKNCADKGCDYCLNSSNEKKVNENDIDNEKTKCVCIHSEENAILEVGRKEIIKIKKSSKENQKITLYSTRKPCLHCRKLICQAEITRVCYNIGDVEEIEDKKFDLTLEKINFKSVFEQEHEKSSFVISKN